MRKDLEENKNKRIGEENYNNFGTLMKIVEYNKCSDIIVEFQDEYKARVHGAYREFKKGSIKNPFDKEVFGVAFCGQGKYKSRGEDGKKTKAYKYWHHMLRRCYDPYELNRNPTYIDVYVCNEWLCFQNFAEWFYKNYYECDNEMMCLDKDILVKGNSIYSPKTCILVPEKINKLFIKQNRCRGKYPIGVHWNKRNCKFVSQCSIYDEDRKEVKSLGYYNSSIEAFIAYKQFKENYIKQVADKYKNKIPTKLYEAMYSYEIEIND